MARRKSYGKKRHYSRGGMTRGIWGQLLGVGIYIGYEKYLEPMVPLQEPILSIAELAVTYWMSKKGGIVGDIGKAGFIINVYQLGKYYSNSLPSIGQGTGQVTSMFAY